MKDHRNIFKTVLFISHASVTAETFIKSWLVLSIVILTVPVFQGCSKTAHPQDSDFTEGIHKSSVKIAVHHPDGIGAHTLDALIFNDDLLQRLDCYQQMEWSGQEDIMIGSCSGRKILLLCANLNKGRDFWKQYNSFTKVKELKVDLEDESTDYPVMVSSTHICASDNTPVSLERLSSEVILNSIRCDFSGRPYAGEQITDARVYLTNINATCSVLPSDEDCMERIINHKGLVDQDIASFKDSKLICRKLGDIGPEGIQTSSRFMCYPNTVPEETIGTPFTRLVVEGRIMGETWYWPIDINRGIGAIRPEGIGRNRRYVFDITIRSKGTKDPDTPVTREMLETVFVVEKWKEKEEYSVVF